MRASAPADLRVEPRVIPKHTLPTTRATDFGRLKNFVYRAHAEAAKEVLEEHKAKAATLRACLHPSRRWRGRQPLLGAVFATVGEGLVK
eukprot:3388866-Pyramimonas_sp.AAC.1